ncbi:MAG TPA: PIN domain-containing protein [Candidatus Thermoplasmatota archaeon]|nr:PIN domain-containing protein [Candidatus Thermoplasmatota archaeon]
MASDGPSAVLLDTSVWIRILNGNAAARSALDTHAEADLFTHPLVIAELRAASLRRRTRRFGIVEEVESVSVLQDLTRDDALDGAATWVRLRKAGREKVSIADCLILATARRVGATLLTCDTDLRKEAGVTVVA